MSCEFRTRSANKTKESIKYSWLCCVLSAEFLSLFWSDRRILRQEGTRGLYCQSSSGLHSEQAPNLNISEWRTEMKSSFIIFLLGCISLQILMILDSFDSVQGKYCMWPTCLSALGPNHNSCKYRAEEEYAVRPSRHPNLQSEWWSSLWIPNACEKIACNPGMIICWYSFFVVGDPHTQSLTLWSLRSPIRPPTSSVSM